MTATLLKHVAVKIRVGMAYHGNLIPGLKTSFHYFVNESNSGEQFMCMVQVQW